MGNHAWGVTTVYQQSVGGFEATEESGRLHGGLRGRALRKVSWGLGGYMCVAYVDCGATSLRLYVTSSQNYTSHAASLLRHDDAASLRHYVSASRRRRTTHPTSLHYYVTTTLRRYVTTSLRVITSLPHGTMRQYELYIATSLRHGVTTSRYVTTSQNYTPYVMTSRSATSQSTMSLRRYFTTSLQTIRHYKNKITLVWNYTSVSLHHYELYVSTKIEYCGVHLSTAVRFGGVSSDGAELYPGGASCVNRSTDYVVGVIRGDQGSMDYVTYLA